MALAKNKNKKTLIGEQAQQARERNEVWMRRGANRSSDNNNPKRPKGHKDQSVRAASHAGRGF